MASSLLKLCDRTKEEERLSRVDNMAYDGFHEREFHKFEFRFRMLTMVEVIPVRIIQ